MFCQCKEQVIFGEKTLMQKHIHMHVQANGLKVQTIHLLVVYKLLLSLRLILKIKT